MKSDYTFLATWKKVKDVFVKPKLHWYFGTWKHEHNLPVWRRGPQIVLSKYDEYETEYDYARLVSCKWTELGRQNHPILSRFFKPVYQLPIWLSFHFFNNDIMYKTKWSDDDFRYEFPSHITLVFFGLAISVTAYIPNDKDEFAISDRYWESVLTYLYYGGDIKATHEKMGYYLNSVDEFEFAFKPEFLKNEKDREYLIQLQYVDSIKIKKEIENKKTNKYYIKTVLKFEDDDEVVSYITKYENKVLVYNDKWSALDAVNNLQSITVKKNGKKVIVEYIVDSINVKDITNKGYLLYKSAIVDKNFDMLKNVI